MDEGPSPPSITARRVAAYRTNFERLPFPHGDPEADEALARDVAGDTSTGNSEWMTRYLRVRTAFFDRVVVNAMERGVTQLVSVGAGYDGRALRYAQAGVRWWEVDQTATQADKRERLARLGVGADHIGFISHDLNQTGLAAKLIQAGYQPDATGLFISEGVAVYLEISTLEMLLEEIRCLATVGTRIALSLRASGSDLRAARGKRFEQTVAGLGEPARNSLTIEQAVPLLGATRWRTVDISERSQRVGLLVAGPVWAPTGVGGPATYSRVGAFSERMLHRAGTDSLGEHLAARYGTPVTAMDQLDLGVYRVGRADGSTWVARLYPAARSIEAVEREAATLAWLAEQAFPAERAAHAEPVSCHHGQPVLVTEFLAGHRARATPTTYSTLGQLVARLHISEAPPLARSAGGAWHHLALDCGLAAEKQAAIELFDAARHRVAPDHHSAFDDLAAELEALDDLSDLPHAFAHPDPVPLNFIAGRQGSVLVDWTGAGWAPRLASLGCLLWAASGRGQASIDAVVAAYRSSVGLERPELERLEPAMAIRPLLLACWSFATGRAALADQAAWWRGQRHRIRRAAGWAQRSFEAE